MTVIYMLLGWAVLQILTAPLIGRFCSMSSEPEPAPAQFPSSELRAAVDDRQVTRDSDRHPMVR